MSPASSEGRSSGGASAAVPPGYELVRELGRGAFGTVVAARHVALGRLCAVKRLAVVPAAGSEAVGRFRREAKALARLDHPGVVRLYDVVWSGDRLYIVMEYVEGADLQHLLREGGLDASGALVVLGDVSSALDHAASRGVVHRDVKPANVFVSPSGRAKLGDFGVARILGDTTVFRTAAGTAVGSLAYMAPEQLRGEPHIGPSADVYSLAVMACELTTGRLPFDASTGRAMVDAHLHGVPRDPRSVVSGYPGAAADLLLAGLDKRPSNRPTATQIGDAVRQLDPTSLVLPLPAPSLPVGSTAGDRSTATGVAPGAATEVTEAGRRGSPGAPPAVESEGGGAARSEAEDAGPVPAVGWIEAPVFRPERRRRRRLRRVLLVGCLGVAGLGLVWVASRPDAVEVRSARVRLSGPRTVPCGRSTLVFHGAIVTNGGAGLVRLRWTGPDGIRRPAVDVEVADGTDEVDAELEFRTTPSESWQGAARLQVLEPSRLDAVSPTVVYSCP